MNPVDYALLSKRAYTDAPTVGTTNSASRMHVYGDVHCFRGTDDLDSLLHDVDCMTVETSIGRVHAGFWDALQAILPACLALPPPRAVTGHSLGAAMAILYAGVLAERDHTVELYAFEPPRVSGDDWLASFLALAKVKWYATRNGNDLITQIPLGLSLPGPLTTIGSALLPFDNIQDHGIDLVIAALA